MWAIVSTSDSQYNMTAERQPHDRPPTLPADSRRSDGNSAANPPFVHAQQLNVIPLHALHPGPDFFHREMGDFLGTYNPIVSEKTGEGGARDLCHAGPRLDSTAP
jgi:hypothetical protein